MKIYIDILIVTNYIISYFLLMATAKICGKKIITKRIIVSSLIGAMGSLSIFLTINNSIVIVILVFLMVLTMFEIHSFIQFLKYLSIFFIVNFMFAGFIFAITIFLNPKNILFYNGIVYFDISTIGLIICISLSYLIITLFNSILSGMQAKVEDYNIIIEAFEKKVERKGIIDTGNSLKDPFSGRPVIVCDLKCLQSILPLHIVELVNKGIDAEFETMPSGIRYIPFHTANGSSMMCCFEPTKLILQKEDKKYIVEHVYIGITKDEIQTILLSPYMKLEQER